MNLIEALHDPRVFGGLQAFRDLSTWSAWIVLAKSVYGIPLDPAETNVFRECTGLVQPRPGGYQTAAAVVGRQAGKSLFAAVIVAFEAATAQNGRGKFCTLLAQDERSARRVLFQYVRECLRVPVLADAVTSETADTVELRDGPTVAVYPGGRPQAMRGIRNVVAVVDELAFFRNSENLPTDTEALRAIRPTLAVSRGRLIILSSPYQSSGALWNLFKENYGNPDGTALVWKAGAKTMNPLLEDDYIARLRADDPVGARAEVDGEFLSGVGALFDPEALEAVVVSDRRELPPSSDTYYRAFADPSGGRSDSFTLAIGHSIPGGRVVVDLLRAWKAPFSPAGVVEEAAALLKKYRLVEVVGDRYGGAWPAERFGAHGITYTPAEKVKSDLYLELLSTVNSARVELLDTPEALSQLRGLERRRGPSGKDRVDHRPGSHDDSANALAGVVSLLAGRDPSDLGITLGDFSGVAGSASLCAWCGGVGQIGTGSVEAPRYPCPAGCPSIETTTSGDVGMTL